MRGLARLEAVLGDELEFVAIAARVAGQVEAAVRFHFREQGAHAVAVAAHEVVDEALEVRRFRDVHRRAARVVRFGGLAHAVDARAEEFVEHVVFIRRRNQFRDRQAHHAGDMAGADIAKVARRHRERHFLLVAGGRCQVTAEVVDDLRHDTRPVDGVDGADLLFCLERQIVRHGLDHILAIVEHAFDGDVVDIRVLQAEHLRRLEGAHFLVRRQHEDADALLAAHRVFGRAARVARRGAKDIEFGARLGQGVFKQIAQQLHGHVLEGQGRAVRQCLQHQGGRSALDGVFFEHAQRRDVGRVFAGAGVLVDCLGIGFRRQCLQVRGRDIGGELLQDFECQVGIRQCAPGVELGTSDLRVVFWEVQSAIGGQAAQEDVGELLLIRWRFISAGRHVVHKFEESS
ncbi:hypothetical protein D3C71_636930 [compost metagenome]